MCMYEQQGVYVDVCGCVWMCVCTYTGYRTFYILIMLVVTPKYKLH